MSGWPRSTGRSGQREEEVEEVGGRRAEKERRKISERQIDSTPTPIHTDIHTGDQAGKCESGSSRNSISGRSLNHNNPVRYAWPSPSISPSISLSLSPAKYEFMHIHVLPYSVHISVR